MAESIKRAVELPDASSPLRIIAMFIALSEALASAAAVATDGTARMMLTSFAVAFPFVVLGVFVWLLIAHTTKLYAPNQFTHETSIAAFAEATRRQTRDEQIVTRSAISAALAPAIVGRSKPESVDEIRSRISKSIDQALEQSSVKIDRSRMILGADNVSIPVSSKTTVQNLLDSIYFALSPAVQAYTYGDEWALLFPDETPIEGVGSDRESAINQGIDHRRLSEIGIEPGVTLTAIRRRAQPTGQRSRSR